MTASKGSRVRAARPSGVLITLAWLACGAVPARAEYALSPGDMLALTVTSVADLDTKAPIDADGRVVLPLIGAVPVAGLTLAEATARIQASLPSKDLNHRLPDGRTVPVIISPSQISLSVAEYRPIYVGGDVAKPGQVAYRPGLTVRQAVVLAGGFDLVRFKLDNPLLQISDLTGEANGLWVEYAKTQANVARLKAELDGVGAIDGSTLTTLPVAKKLTEDIAANEQDQLVTRNTDFTKEQKYLAVASQKESQRAAILAQQEVKETDALKIDTETLERYEELFKKGAIALPGISEARRNVLGSSTRALETTAALASIEREQGELSRRLEHLGDNRRMLILHDLQEAVTALATVKTRLQTVTTKLRFVGAAKSQVISGFDGQVVIGVTRTANGEATHLTPLPDADVQPGDVVEISLPASSSVGASP